MAHGKLDAACLDAVQRALERYRAAAASCGPSWADGVALLDHCGRFARWLREEPMAGSPSGLDEETVSRTTFDVGVIGGGVNGASLHHRLRREGYTPSCSNVATLPPAPVKPPE